MSTIDLREVDIAITFTEEEARFLSGVVEAASSYYSGAQLQCATRIARKFIEASTAKKSDLIAQYGITAVMDMAERAMEAHPDIDEVPIP